MQCDNMPQLRFLSEIYQLLNNRLEIKIISDLSNLKKNKKQRLKIILSKKCTFAMFK